MSELPEPVFELLAYLPINDIEVNEYANVITTSVANNYKKGEYEFAYFGSHLLFMTFIYCSVWKIGQFYKERYEDTILFARPYNGKKLDLKKVNSIFDYSQIPEKDIFKFFTLVDIDPGYIGNVVDLVDRRNNMAHATGKISIISEEDFNEAMKQILSIAKNLNEKMAKPIRQFYEEVLLKYSKGEFSADYSTPIDVIQEELIKGLSFSQKEILICSEFGLSKFNNREAYTLSATEIASIRQLHEITKEIYNENFGVDVSA